MEDISLVTYNNILYYLYKDYIYSSADLSRLFPLEPADKERFISLILNLSLYRNLTSYPALLILSNEPNIQYYLITSLNDNILIWGNDFPTTYSYKVSEIVNIKYPDISQMIYDEDYLVLPEIRLPPINQELISMLIQTPMNVPIILMNPSKDEPIGYDQNIKAVNSYNLLFNEFYEDPTLAQYNNRSGDFISFQDAADLLSRHQIQSYIIDPGLQNIAIPQPPNYILTLFSKSGQVYLVKVRFDQTHNTIQPPI